jgi:hypothetical protein
MASSVSKWALPDLQAFVWYVVRMAPQLPGHGGWCRSSSGPGCPECPVCGCQADDLFGVSGAITLETPNKPGAGTAGQARDTPGTANLKTDRANLPPMTHDNAIALNV